MSQFKIMFVCTQNIFRSVTGHYALKQYLKDNNISGVKIYSAGTYGKKEDPEPRVLDTLKELGVSTRGYKQQKLTKKFAEEMDLIVCMHKYHQNFIMEEFGLPSILFNTLAIQKDTSVRDVDQVRPLITTEKGITKYILKTVHYIYDHIPAFYDQLLERYLIFDQFISGRKKHANGYPYMPLHESKHSVAFMSIDIPEKEDGHILVIPKKRYKRFDTLPSHIQADLMRTVSLIGKVLMQTHTGYNILLNNGRSAGQYVFHTHFHMIPRREGDNIKIEVWNKKKMSKKDFIRLNKEFSKRLKKLAKKK